MFPGRSELTYDGFDDIDEGVVVQGEGEALGHPINMFVIVM